MVANVADWWFVDFDKTSETTEDYMRNTQRAIDDMRRRAEARGRKVRFALNPFIAFGDSVEDATDRAVKLLTPDEPDADVRKMVQRIESNS